MADTNKINALSVLKGLLSKAYKLDDGKLAEIFDAEDATDEKVSQALAELDILRVSELKKQNADNKDSFNQGYAKALKETREKFEKEIKDSFDVESENTGLDLINEIVTLKTPAGGQGSATITDDDVKKHPVYQGMERQFKKDIKQLNDDHTAKLTEVETAAKRNETFNSVRENAATILEKMNPILAKNPTVANTVKNLFFDSLKGFEYERQEDGTFMVTKDGKVQSDQHGHTKSFEDIVKGIAGNFFEFQENNGGQNAGNQNNNGGAGGGGAAGKTFKSAKEAMEYANDSSIPLADRQAALKAFNESNTQD